MAEFKLEDLMPMSIMKGPPLPRFLVIYWPWYTEKPPGTYRLTVSRVGNGTVTPGSGDYTAGTTVTLTAVPDTGGAIFDHWEGAAVGTSATVTILMDGDKEVTAYFTGGPPVGRQPIVIIWQ